MTTFRGSPMTHEAAEDILFGWIEPHRGNKPFSWLVAAGKNPAYDYFPCQHQLFTRGKGKGQMWYEPVFKVRQLILIKNVCKYVSTGRIQCTSLANTSS